MSDFIPLLPWFGRIAILTGVILISLCMLFPTQNEIAQIKWIIANMRTNNMISMSRYRGPNSTYLRTLTRRSYLLGSTSVKQSVELPEFLKPDGFLVQSGDGEILGSGKIGEQFIPLRRPLKAGETYSIISTLPGGHEPCVHSEKAE